MQKQVTVTEYQKYKSLWESKGKDDVIKRMLLREIARRQSLIKQNLH